MTLFIAGCRLLHKLYNLSNYMATCSTYVLVGKLHQSLDYYSCLYMTYLYKKDDLGLMVEQEVYVYIYSMAFWLRVQLRSRTANKPEQVLFQISPFLLSGLNLQLGQM